MKKLIAISIPVVLLFSACGGGQTEEPKAADTSTGAQLMQGRIDSMRLSMNDDTIYNARGAQELLDVYKAYAKAYPLDSLSPEFLFRAAGLSDPLGRPDESVVLYDRVIKSYPAWPRLVDCYYLKALTIDKMGRKGEARMAYEEVINRFPDHQFAIDAKQMIENLQYTDQELIEKFRMQNGLEAQAAANASQPPALSKAEQSAADKAATEAKEKAKGVK
jgi:tetratricopeptide (TPR) repeat protein